MGYECPAKDLERFVRSATPSSSPTTSSTTTPVTSRTSSLASSRSQSPSKGRKKRRASSLSDEEADSDKTIVGSESDDSSKAANDDSFALVKGKTKKAIRKALKKSKTSPASPINEMDIEQSQATATSAAPAAVVATQAPVVASTQATTNKITPRVGAKPTAPPRSKLPPPIFLRKGANFLKISADCTRLLINYTKAVRTADDGIKMFCPDVETFRSLNKYLVDSKVQFHTYALEEERKIKAVIRGIPTDFPVEEIQNDLCGQGFPVHAVHRLCRRDGSPLWLVLAVLPRTEEAKNIFNQLNKVCGLSGIRVEAPHKKGGPGQCHRCQLYGHAAANCHANPRCVKCLVPHWTRECPLTRESGEKPSCVNCGQQHTANYRGCPKAPKFNPHNRPKNRPVAPPRDLNNFPELPGHKPSPQAAPSRPASNPWSKSKPTLPPRAAPEPSGEAVRRAPPVSPPASASATAGASSFGDDVQTVMAVLRAVSSSEISEFARDLRACRSVDEKLLVLVRYHHLMVRLESI
ncbi:Nucleic-acid-binding protein from transposon X-element [Eumeta japonica]|uniref:Nucleic-acid-binding protein from transposon X-element n=1 Tax=Eumeta variegata TaxID=151549 RepID=A0A4C1XWW9_EUMVA|nr:Nucleic-acid-binding protein from transposon X-element [Eumeta japonica]